MAGTGEAEVYEVGEQVGLQVRFGSDEQPVDPPRVGFRVRDPGGRVLDLTYGRDEAVVRAGPGTYQVVIEASVPGRWRYRFSGTGRGELGALDGHFDVFDLGGD